MNKSEPIIAPKYRVIIVELLIIGLALIGLLFGRLDFQLFAIFCQMTVIISKMKGK